MTSDAVVRFALGLRSEGTRGIVSMRIPDILGVLAEVDSSRRPPHDRGGMRAHLGGDVYSLRMKCQGVSMKKK